jgi:thiol-disulfide isomerase/thioredoxin
MIFRSLFIASLVFLTACYGRPQMRSRSVPIAQLGLQTGKPAVLAFSALWCHPCREEIETLNQASQEFAGQIQFAGFLVEGEGKGSPVQTSDLDKFRSFSGTKPLYPMRLDTSWQLFDTLPVPQGRALPTLILVNEKGDTVEVVQQSLDYNSQLRPILAAIAKGQMAPVPTPPSPPPTSGLQQLTDSVQNWIARAEVIAQPDLQKNLTGAWQTGLLKYDFTEDEMPLGSGRITFGWDGNEKNVPEVANWRAVTADSVCKLQLNLNQDGTLASASGSCRPK